MIGSAQRQGHDGKRGILLAGSSETASIGDEKIFHIPCLAIAVEHRCAWIFSHANRPHLVAGKSAGAVTETRKYCAFHVRRNLQHALFGRLPQSTIILAKAKMHYRSRNSMGVHAGWID